jgi:hypothetical protein
MSYYIGGIALLVGAFYIWFSARHRRLVISARERAAAKTGEAPEADPALSAMSMTILPFFVLYGAFASLLLVGGYFLSDLKLYLSLFDLVALLFLIGAYTTWLVIRTHYSKLGLNFADN